MHDQADELRQLVRQRTGSGAPIGPTAPLIVVSGGKGGVGTTTVAANLAVALARQGRRAVFVDADLDHGGNNQLGQYLDRGSVVDVLTGRRNVHEVLQRGPSGIQVLSGAWASGELTDVAAPAQARFIEGLKRLAPHAEVVVLDAGSSRGQFARRLWQAASTVLVVTTTDDASILQCYAAIKVLSDGESSAATQTLVNLASDVDSATDSHARIGEACQRFLGLRTSSAGSMPACERQGEPVLVFPPRCESARSMDRIADTLWAQSQLAAARNAEARRATSVSASC
jgi:flagellar biosynthesis protein FlhG